MRTPPPAVSLEGCTSILEQIRGAPKFPTKIAAAARSFCRTQAAAKVCRPARHFARLTALAQRLIQPHLCRRRRTDTGPAPGRQQQLEFARGPAANAALGGLRRGLPSLMMLYSGQG